MRARRMTSETVSPFLAAFVLAAFQTSSLTRTTRFFVAASLPRPAPRPVWGLTAPARRGCAPARLCVREVQHALWLAADVLVAGCRTSGRTSSGHGQEREPRSGHRGEGEHGDRRVEHDSHLGPLGSAYAVRPKCRSCICSRATSS